MAELPKDKSLVRSAFLLASQGEEGGGER